MFMSHIVQLTTYWTDWVELSWRLTWIRLKDVFQSNFWISGCCSHYELTDMHSKPRTDVGNHNCVVNNIKISVNIRYFKSFQVFHNFHVALINLHCCLTGLHSTQHWTVNSQTTEFKRIGGKLNDWTSKEQFVFAIKELQVVKIIAWPALSSREGISQWNSNRFEMMSS